MADHEPTAGRDPIELRDAAEPRDAATELIVYACPNGPLADALTDFFAATRRAPGPNRAHAYPPHVTLTGFFRDHPSSVGVYVRALDAARDAWWSSRPQPVVAVTELAVHDHWIGLVVRSPWLERLIADFADHAVSATRAEAIRVKGGLHLSMAYEHAPAERDALATAAARVDPAAAAGWDLRLYERTGEGGWRMHATWPLEVARDATATTDV
ncbi:MAG: hypothetical protein S0880_31540 [Actinomycetota bacterium]|nr:hypothetical protein [Actinomycetota bacterium]